MQSRVVVFCGRTSDGLAILLVGMMALGGRVQARAGNPFGPPPVPDWVRTAAQQKLPEFHGNPKAVVLLDETTYTVDAKGQAIQHVRRVVKILRPQGREYGYPVVPYDKDSKVLSLYVWSIDPSGQEYSVKDSEMADIGAPGEGGDLYSDERAKVVDPPGRDPGGIVAYEYEVRERPYLAEANWEFQDDLPRMQQSFTLILPTRYNYTTTWVHHAKVPSRLWAMRKALQHAGITSRASCWLCRRTTKPCGSIMPSSRARTRRAWC